MYMYIIDLGWYIIEQDVESTVIKFPINAQSKQVVLNTNKD